MNRFFLPFLFALALAMSPSLSAQSSKAETQASPNEVKKKPAKSRSSYPIYGQLVSITSKTLTIRSGEDKPERKFALTKDTVILKDQKPASLEDAKDGQWIGGSVSKSEQGHDRVLKLNLSAKPKGAKSSNKTNLAKKGSTP